MHLNNSCNITHFTNSSGYKYDSGKTGHVKCMSWKWMSAFVISNIGIRYYSPDSRGQAWVQSQMDNWIPCKLIDRTALSMIYFITNCVTSATGCSAAGIAKQQRKYLNWTLRGIGFPSQRASKAESTSVSRHHESLGTHVLVLMENQAVDRWEQYW